MTTPVQQSVPSPAPVKHYEWIIFTAGIIGLTSFSTLLRHVYKTHNTDSLPWIWIIMNITAQCFSITYALIKGAYGMYIPGFIFISGLLFLLYMKVKYKHPVIVPDGKDTKDGKK